MDKINLTKTLLSGLGVIVAIQFKHSNTSNTTNFFVSRARGCIVSRFPWRERERERERERQI